MKEHCMCGDPECPFCYPEFTYVDPGDEYDSRDDVYEYWEKFDREKEM